MTDKKRFQIILDKQVHEQIKARSTQLRLEIGDMIQNLLGSFEFRLQHLYERIEKDGGPIDSIYLENSLIKLLFKQDREGLTEDEFTKELDHIVKGIRETNKKLPKWEPKIKLGNEQPAGTKTTKGDK